MKKFLKDTALMIAAVLSFSIFQSCSSDDGYSLGKQEIHYMTVKLLEGENPNNSFYLVDESLGLKYWVAAPIYSNNSYADGQRAIANITPLSGTQGDYDHYVRLNSMFKVLTKPVNVLKPGETDDFGTDRVGLVSGVFWPGVLLDGFYVNVAYSLFDPSHTIALIKNEHKTYEDDGYLHLELRYDAKGSIQDKYLLGRVSFNLESLDVDLASFKGIKIDRINLQGDLETLPALDFPEEAQ